MPPQELIGFPVGYPIPHTTPPNPMCRPPSGSSGQRAPPLPRRPRRLVGRIWGRGAPPAKRKKGLCVACTPSKAEVICTTVRCHLWHPQTNDLCACQSICFGCSRTWMSGFLFSAQPLPHHQPLPITADITSDGISDTTLRYNSQMQPSHSMLRYNPQIQPSDTTNIYNSKMGASDTALRYNRSPFIPMAFPPASWSHIGPRGRWAGFWQRNTTEDLTLHSTKYNLNSLVFFRSRVLGLSYAITRFPYPEYRTLYDPNIPPPLCFKQPIFSASTNFQANNGACPHLLSYQCSQEGPGLGRVGTKILVKILCWNKFHAAHAMISGRDA
jgi:hypothetical protein